MLIGLCGFKRSGKDTLAEILVDGAGFARLAFADAIKSELADEGVIEPPESLKDLQGTDGLSYRDKVIARGEARRATDPAYWLKKIVSATAQWPQDKDIVITDCRFPIEIAWVRKSGGLLVWVERAGVTSNGHETEQDLSCICDWTIVNNGPLPSARDLLLAFDCAFEERDCQPVEGTSGP